MAIEQYPQLIFLSGPDGGRTVKLDVMPVTIGRASNCGLKLNEQYASREQAEFSQSSDGVVVENLSSRGTVINGKTYKRGKGVLLGTGDVLGIGLETEVLFVACGDDPDIALATLKTQRDADLADKKAREEKPKKEKKKAPPVEEPLASPAKELTEELEEDQHQALTPGQKAEQERGKRRRRLMIILGGYMGLMVVAFIFLSIYLKGDTGQAGVKRPARMTHEEIKVALEKAEDEPAGSVMAAAALDAARRKFAQLSLSAQNPFECVSQYKRYLVLSGRSGFESASDLTSYNTAMDNLMADVTSAYDKGYAASQQERWSEANKQFHKVLELVPDSRNGVYMSVIDHLGYITRSSAKKTGSKFYD